MSTIRPDFSFKEGEVHCWHWWRGRSGGRLKFLPFGISIAWLGQAMLLCVWFSRDGKTWGFSV